MISSDRMRSIDRNAAAHGVPQRVLMESSGNAIARRVRERCDAGDRVTIIAGRGNNGGDGVAAARFLSAFDVTVYLLGRPESIATDIARRNWEALEATDHDVRTIGDASEIEAIDADVIVDAMLGTGIDGDLREPVASAVDAVREAVGHVIAVDVPTGVHPDTGDRSNPAVAPDEVVTFHAMKPGLDALEAPVHVADIGIPRAADTDVGPGDVRTLDRAAASHKGDAGRVLVVGGGPYTGAPALTGMAALRGGADLVTVATPAVAAPAVRSERPDLIVRELPGEHLTPESIDAVRSLANDADVVVIGPGLGASPDTLRAVREFLRTFEGRGVVDADALGVVPDVDSPATLVCTPHQGEFEEMGGPPTANLAERRAGVASFAAELDHTLLVKGNVDVVSDGERTRLARTGNPGMTVGGTGDVLAGLVGGLLAQLADPLDAAGIGAYVNGRAGDRAADTLGNGLVASDLLDRIPVAIEEAHA